MSRKVSDLQMPDNFQILKKGKPFSKLASDSTTNRMSRENYFKIAETQDIGMMRSNLNMLNRNSPSADKEISIIHNEPVRKTSGMHFATRKQSD